MQVQYVTNENGKQVGVLLDITTYQHLIASAPSDPELLTDLNREELEALAESKIALETQTQLDDLLQKQEKQTLSDAENSQLENILAQIDQLTILKTRAKYTLNIAKSQ